MRSHLRESKASGSTKRLVERIVAGRAPKRTKRTEGQSFAFNHCGRRHQ
jgi:hypothetical protein